MGRRGEPRTREESILEDYFFVAGSWNNPRGPRQAKSVSWKIGSLSAGAINQRSLSGTQRRKCQNHDRRGGYLGPNGVIAFAIWMG